jgi:hypothetical protein
MLAGGATLIGMAACGSDSTTQPRTLSTITVAPNPVTLLPGATQQFTAVGKDAGGSVVAFNPTWAVASGGGTIDNNGLLTASTTSGTYNDAVTASNGSVSGSSTVTVSVVAEFTLQSVDGKAPPDTVVNTGTLTVEFLDGKLSLNADASYKVLFHTRTTTSGGTVSDTSGSTGTYTVNGTAVTLHNTGNNANVIATVTAPTISFTDNQELFVFTKATP